MNRFRALRFLAIAVTLLLTSGVWGQEMRVVGLPRAAVIEQLGQPTANLHGVGREILVFADGESVELIDGAVVVHHPQSGILISSDGTRYRSGANGELIPEPIIAPAPISMETADPVAEADEAPAPVSLASPETVVEAVIASPPNEPALEESEEPTASAKLPEDEQGLPGVADLDSDKLMEDLGLEESEPPPSWAKGVTAIISMAARFAIMLVALQIALKWVGRAYYLPDLLKATALSVVVRDGLHALGGLGDWWQMIPLSRGDEIAAALTLALLLFKAEVTRNGLTALTIAGATYVGTLCMMPAVGLAVTFWLPMAF